MSEESLGGLGFILVMAVIWLGITVHNQNKTIEQYKGIIDDCSVSIGEANQRISDAKDNAWLNYNDMGQALDDLETVDDPCFIPQK